MLPHELMQRMRLQRSIMISLERTLRTFRTLAPRGGSLVRNPHTLLNIITPNTRWVFGKCISKIAWAAADTINRSQFPDGHRISWPAAVMPCECAGHLISGAGGSSGGGPWPQPTRSSRTSPSIKARCHSERSAMKHVLIRVTSEWCKAKGSTNICHF